MAIFCDTLPSPFHTCFTFCIKWTLFKIPADSYSFLFYMNSLMKFGYNIEMNTYIPLIAIKCGLHTRFP